MEIVRMKTHHLAGAALAALLLIGDGRVEVAGQTDHPDHGNQAGQQNGVPLYDDLGSHHFEITTDVPLTQQYFDQGVRLYYAFNHAEAIRAFEEGLRLDPACAMCAWGVALSLGPNINAAMDPAGAPRAHAEIRRASSLSGSASPLERSLIAALATRYLPEAPDVRAALDSAYSSAMGDVARRFPESTEAGVLFAESIMDLSPWNYWTADGEPRPGVRDALQRLENVLAADPNHPGACHFFIHAVEAIAPERAVPCAERLASLMPGAGHLVHMPGHIYVRVGRWADAIAANEHAVHADESYIQDQRPGVGTYTAGYYPHNYDFMAFAAAMAGRSEQAIGAAEKVASLVPAEMLHSGQLPFLQQFIMRPLQQKVRFGRWDEVLTAPAPADGLPYSAALWHFSRGVAFAGTGNLRAAERELVGVRAAAEGPELEGVNLEFNSAQSLLRMAVGILEGRIAAEKGEVEDAIRALNRAAAEEDALTYGEPPEWAVPVRQELGTVLLEAGRFPEAEAAFRRDLARHPENGWSLRGLQLSLEGQGRGAEAAEVRRRFEKAWTAADVAIDSARF
jgi:tetratricopeptide (TPR) repeat protein